MFFYGGFVASFVSGRSIDFCTNSTFALSVFLLQTALGITKYHHRLLCEFDIYFIRFFYSKRHEASANIFMDFVRIWHLLYPSLFYPPSSGRHAMRCLYVIGRDSWVREMSSTYWLDLDSSHGVGVRSPSVVCPLPGVYSRRRLCENYCYCYWYSYCYCAPYCAPP